MKPFQATLAALITIAIGWAAYNAFNAEKADTESGADKVPYLTSAQVIETRIKNQFEGEDNPDFDAVENDIAALLSKSPLNDNGLFYHTQSLILQKDWARFNPAIFSTIQSRNPRNRKNLRAFLNYSVSLGDWPAVLEILDRLYRLERDERDPQLGLLTTIYTLDSGQADIDASLAQVPSWGRAFIDTSVMNADDSLNAPLRKSLLIYTEASPQKTDMLKAAERLTRKTLGLGLISEAYAFWKEVTALSGGEDSRETSLNYNPNLAKRASPPPFNWLFPPFKGLNVDFEKNGVFMSFLGEQKRTVATQYYLPKRGPTKIDIKAQYNYNNRQGMFAVNTRCLAPLQGLYTIELDETHRGLGNIVQTIPAFEQKCDLAVLNITAQPGVFKERISANFESVTLTSLGAVAP